MKKALKIIAIGIVVLFIGIQFFAIDKNDPPVDPNETIQAAVVVPSDIYEILGRSCNDCHSNMTTYPWYAYVQPSGWFLKDHIDHARGHLNFSVFNTYSPQKKIKKLEEICEEVGAGNMPLPSYLWLHRDAVLSSSDASALCDWARNAGRTIEESPATP